MKVLYGPMAKMMSSCSGCGSVGRRVYSDTRGPWFELGHWRILFRTFTVNFSVLKRRKRKKRPGMAHFFKQMLSNGRIMLRQTLSTRRSRRRKKIIVGCEVIGWRWRQGGIRTLTRMSASLRPFLCARISASVQMAKARRSHLKKKYLLFIKCSISDL